MGLKQSKTRYIHQDARIKLKDSAICLLTLYWYLCSHDPHGLKSPSPEGVDHLALPLVPEVKAPSAYLTTHSLSPKKNRNTMKGISKLSSIFCKTNHLDHLGNFRNLQDEIKAGNLDRECVPPSELGPFPSTFPWTALTQSWCGRRESATLVGFKQIIWCCQWRWKDGWGDSAWYSWDSWQCRHIVDKLILLHIVEVCQCHRPQKKCFDWALNHWQDSQLTRNSCWMPCRFPISGLCTVIVICTTWTSQLSQVGSKLNDCQSIDTYPVSHYLPCINCQHPATPVATWGQCDLHQE